ncbi:MAG TPA: hypothetical protein VFK73_05075 [Paludibacter sp.]|nr:hypothetical protein [Paludibacter sp.]
MAQNLISATLTAADAGEVQKNLKEAKDKLVFLLSLQPSDINGIIKLGNAFLPFIDKIYQTVNDHPEILSGVFNKEEFLSDYALLNSLRPIVNQMNELAEGVQKTFYAVGSDVLVASLDVYSSVKQSQDKVPGLKATADELAVFFKRAKATKQAQ